LKKSCCILLTSLFDNVSLQDGWSAGVLDRWQIDNVTIVVSGSNPFGTISVFQVQLRYCMKLSYKSSLFTMTLTFILKPVHP